MRCLACNNNLSDFEATRKYASNSQYVDLCNRCFNPIAADVLVIERGDLKKTEEQLDVETEDQGI